ncbi:DUF481 domain-containing protein [bacterium]|nr:DUF481 domain-containing protein [bacterium]
MKRLRLQTNVLIVTVTIFCCCHSITVNAEEAGVQSNTPTEQTPPPALAASRNVTATAELTEQSTEQAVELPVTPTPQPPLIDAQPEPSYEPATIDNTAVEKTGRTTEQVIEQTIEVTPQPPLIDAQQTSAEPDNIDGSDTEETYQQTGKSEQATEWSDLRPYQVEADWVQLKSGEWLRGRIIAMQDFRLEFYSDELKKLTIKWRNVKYIKTSAPYRLRFEDQTIVVGAIEITPDKVQVITDYDELTFDRGTLLTIASGKDTGLSLWTFNITASINLRRGNTDQTDFTSRINTKRQTAFSRVTIDYLGNFTEVRETETINNHRLNGAYNIFFGRHLFVSPIVAEMYRDPFQNIARRIYAGAGLGYWLIKNIYTEWDISGGPAYQSTMFDSVQPGQSPEKNTLTLVLSTRFNSKLNSKVDLEGFYIATLGDSSIGNYTHHSMFTVKTELYDEFYLDVSFAWDRTRRPVENADGVVPEQDDFKILVGLRYDY